MFLFTPRGHKNAAGVSNVPTTIAQRSTSEILGIGEGEEVLISVASALGSDARSVFRRARIQPVKELPGSLYRSNRENGLFRMLSLHCDSKVNGAKAQEFFCEKIASFLKDHDLSGIISSYFSKEIDPLGQLLKFSEIVYSCSDLVGEEQVLFVFGARYLFQQWIEQKLIGDFGLELSKYQEQEMINAYIILGIELWRSSGNPRFALQAIDFARRGIKSASGSAKGGRVTSSKEENKDVDEVCILVDQQGFGVTEACRRVLGPGSSSKNVEALRRQVYRNKRSN